MNHRTSTSCAISLLQKYGRILTLPLEKYAWLQWLAQASSEQRAHWTIEPGGYAVYWDDPDDGIEIEHVLSLNALH
jgi:hypothetical protein